MLDWLQLIFLCALVYFAGVMSEGNAWLTTLIVFVMGAAVIFLKSLDEA
jgi:hypothetical protein